MHDETVRVAQQVTDRIERVNVDGVLGVESVDRRGGSEADRHRLAGP